MKRRLPALALFTVLIAADYFTKQLAVRDLKGSDPYVIWDGVFELRYTENTGAAFGILQDQRFLFLLLTMTILAAIIFLYLKLPRTRHFLPLRLLAVFIAAGAVGNAIDRVAHGYVVDFMYIRLIDFPVFNVADIFISWSAVLLILFLLFFYKNEDLKEIFK